MQQKLKRHQAIEKSIISKGGMDSEWVRNSPLIQKKAKSQQKIFANAITQKKVNSNISAMKVPPTNYFNKIQADATHKLLPQGNNQILNNFNITDNFNTNKTLGFDDSKAKRCSDTSAYYDFCEGSSYQLKYDISTVEKDKCVESTEILGTTMSFTGGYSLATEQGLFTSVACHNGEKIKYKGFYKTNEGGFGMSMAGVDFSVTMTSGKFDAPFDKALIGFYTKYASNIDMGVDIEGAYIVSADGKTHRLTVDSGFSTPTVSVTGVVGSGEVSTVQMYKNGVWSIIEENQYPSKIKEK